MKSSSFWRFSQDEFFIGQKIITFKKTLIESHMKDEFFLFELSQSFWKIIYLHSKIILL